MEGRQPVRFCMVAFTSREHHGPGSAFNDICPWSRQVARALALSIFSAYFSKFLGEYNIRWVEGSARAMTREEVRGLTMPCF